MEKIQHNRFSKVLVLLMAVIMVLTMMPNGMGGGTTLAWAAEETAQSVKITFSAVIPISNDVKLDPNNTGWNYAVQPQEVTVYAGEAYEYGVGDTPTKTPTVLDAVVAAHKVKYNNFTKDTAAMFLNSGLGSASDNTAAAFGVSNAYFGHVINGMYSELYASTAVIQNGDKVELFPYKSTYPSSDYYGSFGYDEIIVDSAATLTLKGAAYFSLKSPAMMANMGNITIGYLGSSGEIIPLSLTGDSGTLKINDSESGTVISNNQNGQYTLVAYGKYGESGDFLIPAAMKVVVKDSVTDADKLQNVKSRLNWNMIQKQNTQNAYVTSDLNLPTTITEGGESYAITWKSSSSNLVNAKSGLVRGNDYQDKSVVVTATITGNLPEARGMIRLRLST